MKSEIPTPRRPKEVVCFKAMDFNTKMDGPVYIFFADDMYSHFMMVLEPSRKMDTAEILKKTHELMNHKDFIRYPDQAFILVTDFDEGLHKELNMIVKPFKGKVIYNPDYIEVNMLPDLVALLSRPELQ